jgi:hypothetical protein
LGRAGYVVRLSVKITDAIAVEHGTLLRVFEEVERVLPGLRSAAEVGTMATILEGLLRTHASLEGEGDRRAPDGAGSLRGGGVRRVKVAPLWQ